MFSNILAEMARRQMSKQELAKKLNMSVWTLDRKIKHESEFTIDEIWILQKTFNDPSCTFEYLFAE